MVKFALATGLALSAVPMSLHRKLPASNAATQRNRTWVAMMVAREATGVGVGAEVAAGEGEGEGSPEGPIRVSESARCAPGPKGGSY